MHRTRKPCYIESPACVSPADAQASGSQRRNPASHRPWRLRIATPGTLQRAIAQPQAGKTGLKAQAQGSFQPHLVFTPLTAPPDFTCAQRAASSLLVERLAVCCSRCSSPHCAPDSPPPLFAPLRASDSPLPVFASRAACTRHPRCGLRQREGSLPSRPNSPTRLRQRARSGFESLGLVVRPDGL